MKIDYNRKSGWKPWLEYIGGFALIYGVGTLIGILAHTFSTGPGRVEEHGYFNFVGMGVAIVFVVGYYVGYQVGKNTQKSVK